MENKVNNEARLNRKKVLQGIVVSDKMQKTITVKVETKSKHPLYKKLVITHKKYHAADEKEECNVGDFVEIIETRPLSATKRWRLNKIIQKAK
ncbi:MAG: 30S ribosomal protein S17 [Malacoplasma sp.]|nr:30S ribosomal protein S17 [Malacoplasma sp.]